MKDIRGFEGLYKVCESGEIYSMYTNGFLNGCVDAKGYRNVILSGKCGLQVTRKVHRVVAEHFIPNPENKPQVNHINGIKADNRIENLEWCTAKENVQHSMLLKTYLLGTQRFNAKLNNNDVADIRRLHTEGVAGNKIARIYNVTPGTIRAAVNRKTWKHVA